MLGIAVAGLATATIWYSLVSGYRQHLPYKDLATYGQGTKVTDLH